MLGLHQDGVVKTATVHSLVAQAFLGDRPEGYYVCHIDGDPKHNRLSNLRYATPQSNADDKFSHGTQPLGEQHQNSRLTVRDVLRIRARAGEPLQYLADEFGTTKQNICHIQKRRNWRHV
jgi:hypothetical protein